MLVEYGCDINVVYSVNIHKYLLTSCCMSWLQPLSYILLSLWYYRRKKNIAPLFCWKEIYVLEAVVSLSSNKNTDNAKKQL